jgi:prefoldin subunit 5
MPGPDEVERKIREMLIDMGDCRLLSEFEAAIKAFDERSCRIDETLEDLLQEVDDLLQQIDELDAAELESDEDEICIR